MPVSLVGTATKSRNQACILVSLADLALKPSSTACIHSRIGSSSASPISRVRSS
ncbi:hypothetical protein [Aestuariimicrobium ganziense]|uniref:hypothetical protein n=1 Tax=Aestuariimicrobium ganziense TaxID=2773677 RepID=UPI001F2DFF2C|nr:hypothetical protein [Aestuariimicrobium ganziense]